MTSKTDDLKNHLRRSLDHLITLRDEIRVDLHLAGMDLKTRWSALETDLHKMEERVEHDVGEGAKKALDEIAERARKLSAEIKKQVGGTKG